MVNINFFKKETLAIVIFILLSFLFFSLVYIPWQLKLIEVKKEFAFMQKDLIEISGLKVGEGFASEFREELDSKVVMFSKKFPLSEEGTMRELSKLAFEHGVNITSLRSSFKKINQDKENFVSFLGQAPKKVQLVIFAEGTYINLGKFLEDIRTKLNAAAVLEKLSVVKVSDTDKLRIQISLFFYLRDWDG